MGNDKPLMPPELQLLYDQGKAGKLWVMEIIYRVGAEDKMLRKRNMTSGELMQFRLDIFRIGFITPIEPGHWRLICPMDIKQIDLYKQSGYFTDLPSSIGP